jgi:hypothetical protein
MLLEKKTPAPIFIRRTAAASSNLMLPWLGIKRSSLPALLDILAISMNSFFLSCRDWMTSTKRRQSPISLRNGMASRSQRTKSAQNRNLWSLSLARLSDSGEKSNPTA